MWLSAKDGSAFRQITARQTRSAPSPVYNRTRVNPSSVTIKRPKSDKSDFGWRARVGARTHEPCCVPPPPPPPPHRGGGGTRLCTNEHTPPATPCTRGELR